MGIYLERAIFRNIAPFGDLDFHFKENDVIVFSGINGQGKTTVLSYIADAFFEMAKNAHFSGVLDDPKKFYRFPDHVSKININEPSVVYFCFKNQEEKIEYLELMGYSEKVSDAEYNGLKKEIKFDLTINVINSQFSGNSVKAVSLLKQTNAFDKTIFYANILTYFPSDRSEIPAWMNHTEYRQYRFHNTVRFSNELGKNIEVKIVSEDIANWILDVVLDRQSDTANTSAFYIFEQLNKIIRSIIRCKLNLTGPELGRIRFGVGQRNNGQVRLAIVKDNSDQGRNIVSPSVFHLSSGEISLLMIFAELIRQYDRYFNPNSRVPFARENITGIVLIDEVDKHLHIQLQKEVLPELIALFPHVQFIVSSHSPFFALGASQHELLQSRIGFRELPSGNEISINSYPELDKAYDAFISTQIHKSTIEEELRKKSDKPAFFVEGETDIIILTAAWKALYSDEVIPVYFLNGFDRSHIRIMFSRGEIFKKSPARLFFGLFDFDEAYGDWNGVKAGKDKWIDIEINEDKCLTKKHPNEEAYVMLLPVPLSRKLYAGKTLGDKSMMMIEHLFEDDYLKEFCEDLVCAGGGVVKKIINKSGFSEKIISFPADAFLNFKPLFEFMKRVVTPGS